MTTAATRHPVAVDAVTALADPGGHLMPSARLSALAGVDAADWTRFAGHWDELTLDTYMADGGTYRFRRYGQFELDPAAGELTLLPHEPYRQESDINPLNGGIERVFDPLTESFAGDPLLRSVLVELGRIFSAVDGTGSWNVKLHPYRISASADQQGRPAPEGRHRDGVTFITSLLIGRTNVTGGESAVHSDEGEHLLTVTLSEPGDLLLGDDRRTLHSVTPVRPVDPELAAHRDVLVIAYTAR
ncbi:MULTISPECIES: 2OG-Fe dioxygenase family protein [unclassified Streptomyces]|uniref:2OG-Fe dioxygenase family protein n=1 Tax=unclassified Streptomyces TaxID=2593676 RepID=UPI0022583B65|nr:MULTISPECIES: 2OG-Fe dioxygenase family protein [unclassified Streptomyces]MCX5048904.1 2OG-Fe dioxygenase family protein [Streptomyces sp. NBC_00474]MCX5056356.1 2OG-Fe dioxygenase family protein [Streptomyces sp. NBC_00452]MCX5246745.1 2OG-Fe dioxygenase family protein [Streptomyces sp. NBC_00201]MCX5287461.1 2OG-Fe dioxygenase family protein [Streptomyces sp. NBC_00183]